MLKEKNLEYIVEIFNKINNNVNFSDVFIKKLMSILEEDSYLRKKIDFDQHYNFFIQHHNGEVNAHILLFYELRGILIQQNEPQLIIDLLNKTAHLIQPNGKFSAIIAILIKTTGNCVLDWLKNQPVLLNKMLQDKTTIASLKFNKNWQNFILCNRHVLMKKTNYYLNFWPFINYEKIIKPYIDETETEYNNVQQSLIDSNSINFNV